MDPSTNSASITFYNGMRTIGGTHILISEGNSGLIFDLGLKYEPGADLSGTPFQIPAGGEASLHLRTRSAPPIRGLFTGVQEQDFVWAANAGGWPVAGPFEHLAVFISHAHQDHMGLLEHVAADVPVHVHDGTRRILEGLYQGGLTPPTKARLIGHADGGRFTVGTMKATVLPGDHDLPGSAGLLIETEGGTVAYTGDWRRHGLHPERVDAFTRACMARGVDVLLTEGTRFGPTWESPRLPEPIPEADLPQHLDRILAEHSGSFTAVSFYPRNVERIANFAAVAAAHDRRLAVHPETYALLNATCGLHSLDPATVHILKDAEAWGTVVATPSEYLVELRPETFPQLALTLTQTGGVFVHSDGGPLGEHDPTWPLMMAWLRELKMQYIPLRSGGHAAPADVRALVESVRPRVLVPIHSRHPESMLVRGVPVLFPLRGERFEFGRLFHSSTAVALG